MKTVWKILVISILAIIAFSLVVYITINHEKTPSKEPQPRYNFSYNQAKPEPNLTNDSPINQPVIPKEKGGHTK